MGSNPLPPDENPQSMYDVVKMLSRNVVDMEVTIPLRRGHVLEDAIRSVKLKNFHSGTL